ncbi:hypothetical protein [Spiroplasma attinicola]|uniref:hypothetical protein n=1 Tax=Spiroplasma attinicola TaxID=2904537 RepID=UPI002022A3E9|nr:hypothetical protein [Spiroplasma sp. JKS002670]MCL8209592.1 hypothetical protein [Spiroplasma sp. JKS002670]
MATKINNNNKSTTTDDDIKLNSKSWLEQTILDLKAELAEYHDDDSSAYKHVKTSINNQIKFYQSIIKKLKLQEIKEKNVVNDISFNYETDFKMTTKTNNNNNKTKSRKIVTINDSDKNNNDKKETEELTASEILDDIQEIKKEMIEPQQRIEELRSKSWLTAEINELTEKVTENNDIIMRHEKLLLIMEFIYQGERTKENKDLIANIKKVIESRQQEIDITNMVLNLYQTCLQKLD